MENLTLVQGDDQSISLYFYDEETEAPYDITDWKIYFTVKKSISDTDDEAIIQKDVTSHIDPTAGLSAIDITNTESDVEDGVYIYDVQVKDEEDNIITVVTCGRCIITPEVTRRKD